MEIADLRILYNEHPQLQLLERLLHRGTKHILLTGLHASARSVAVSWLAEVGSQKSADAKVESQKSADVKVICAVMDSQDEAQYLYADLKALVEISNQQSQISNREILYFPHSKKRQASDEAMLIQRTEVLGQLLVNREQSQITNHKSQIIVTYPEAIDEPVPPKATFTQHTFTLTKGQEIDITPLTERLAELGFTKVDFVYEPGQFAVRGGIVDIYSFCHELPYRFDFFGNEIDSIREFDIETQLSKQQLQSAEICQMNTLTSDDDESSETLLNYLPHETLWLSNDFTMVAQRSLKADFRKDDNLRTIEINRQSTFAHTEEVAFSTLPQPLFHKQFELLTDDLQDKTKAGYHIYILSEQKKQTDRLKAIIDNINETNSNNPVSFIPVAGILHAGFIDEDMHIACYTDHEVFARYHRISLKA
ncbi:MAG: hypothetical protein MJZ92_00895, partial [Paludibacteraceae bacterium]|nr:hypothetical protein [Paludibacteraceae bacterium]